MLNHSPLKPGEKRPGLIYIASPGETLNMMLWNFMRVDTFNTIPETIYVVFPRGIGRVLWDDEIHRKFERNAMLLGRTLDEMRLYDVLCAVRFAAAQPGFDGKEMTVAGKGVQGSDRRLRSLARFANHTGYFAYTPIDSQNRSNISQYPAIHGCAASSGHVGPARVGVPDSRY